MKTVNFSRLQYNLSICLFLLLASDGFARIDNLEHNESQKSEIQELPDLQKGMYLILGSFKIPSNAVKYAKSLNVGGRTPKVARYDKNGHYYVYAYNTKTDLEFARAKRSELRSTNEFYDAWILYVGITLAELTDSNKDEELSKIQEANGINSAKIEPEDVLFIPPPPVEKDENLYSYIFNVTSATTLKEVPGYITIIDAARNKMIKRVSTNELHKLEAPKTQSREIIAICDIFGYVKEQVKLKIDDPSSGNEQGRVTEDGEVTTVKFELARHKVGEILTMYNVYFFSNAAIMKPESTFELNSLLDMLQENDKLEVKIHGHTNGNTAGKIVRLKEEDDNFFAVSDNNIEDFGSAKDLSKARAEVIQRWLVEKGIDKKRMELKGWGGKKMIYKKLDERAGKNVRVEIEIIKG